MKQLLKRFLRFDLEKRFLLVIMALGVVMIGATVIKNSIYELGIAGERAQNNAARAVFAELGVEYDSYGENKCDDIDLGYTAPGADRPLREQCSEYLSNARRYGSSMAGSDFSLDKTREELKKYKATLDAWQKELAKRGQQGKERVERAKSMMQKTTLTSRDDDGYSFEMEVRISGWMKGDDEQAIEAAYEAMDGSSYDGYGNKQVPSASSNDLVLVGMTRFKNTTKDFSFNSNTYKGNAARLTFKLMSDNEPSSSYSSVFNNVRTNVYFSSPQSGSSRTFTISPQMSIDQTGWIKFYIVVENAIKPSQPDGGSEINNAKLALIAGKTSYYWDDDDIQQRLSIKRAF